jgi:hypothetical protein
MDTQASNPEQRIFCISMQRSGTTSVGKFFRDFGFRWAGWPADADNGWSEAWYRGDFESIFGSPDFQAANAFEDSPWWSPDFYKALFHRFRGSKFVLMTRDPDAWFRSMLAHSSGNVIGDNRSHCKCYRRELEFFDLLASDQIDDLPEGKGRAMTIIGHDEHYKDIYRLHNTEVLDFFAQYGPEMLHHGSLEDPLKWQKLGKFLGVEVPESYDSHLNASRRSENEVRAKPQDAQNIPPELSDRR